MSVPEKFLKSRRSSDVDANGSKMGNLFGRHQRPAFHSTVEPRDTSKEITLCKNPALIIVDQVIGKVNCGYVFSGYLENKKVSLTKVGSSKNCAEEAEFLRNLNHENVIRYLFTFEDVDCVFIVTENFESSLKDCIGVFKFQHSMVQDLMTQLTDAVEYLQSLKIAHLNLTPSSIFIRGGQNKTVKVADFSCAMQFRGGGKQNVKKLPADSTFSAPEICNQGKADLLCDVYSLGAIMFYIYSQGARLNSIERQTSDQIVKTWKSNLKSNDILCVDLIEKLIEFYPWNRLRADVIKQHPFYWDSQRIVNFIIEFNQLIESSDKKFRFQLYENSKRVIGDSENWMMRIEPEILDEINQVKTKFRLNSRYSNEDERVNIISLVKTMRNILVHSQSQTIKDAMGTSELFVKYWLTKFPILIFHLYNVTILNRLQKK